MQMKHLTLPNISQSPIHPTSTLPGALNPQPCHAPTPKPIQPEVLSTAEKRDTLPFVQQLTTYEFEVCKFILNHVHDGMNKLEFTPYYALDPNFTIVMVPNHMAALRRALKKF